MDACAAAQGCPRDKADIDGSCQPPNLRVSGAAKYAGNQSEHATRRGLVSVAAGPSVDPGNCGNTPLSGAAGRSRRLTVRRHHNGRLSTARSASSVPASEFFLEHILQHRLIEREIRHDTLELRVLLPQLTQFSRLRGLHVPVQLLPPVIALLRNPVLPTELRDRSPQVSRLQDPRYVFDRKTLLLHDKTACPVGLILSQNSLPNLAGYLAACHLGQPHHEADFAGCSSAHLTVGRQIVCGHPPWLTVKNHVLRCNGGGAGCRVRGWRHRGFCGVRIRCTDNICRQKGEDQNRCEPTRGLAIIFPRHDNPLEWIA